MRALEIMIRSLFCLVRNSCMINDKSKDAVMLICVCTFVVGHVLGYPVNTSGETEIHLTIIREQHLKITEKHVCTTPSATFR